MTIEEIKIGDIVMLKEVGQLEFIYDSDIMHIFGKTHVVEDIVGDLLALTGGFVVSMQEVSHIANTKKLVSLDCDSVRKRLYKEKGMVEKSKTLPCGGSYGTKDDGFITKDSGKREEFSTGSLRDTQEGKPRYDLLSTHGLKRVAMLMARGAEKYGERNRELGQETDRFLASAMRHIFQYAEGDVSEDHLSAVCFNCMGIMHMQEEGRNDMLKNKADNIFIN